MITRLMVIQCIHENGEIDVFQISSDNFQWTFETEREKLEAEEIYFPFSLFGSFNILKRKPGRETKTILAQNKITFHDDYGVPSGTVVAILLPQNYIPEIIKFKDKPFIPIGFSGHVVTKPSGQFQILYNPYERRCAIIFNIHENVVFGFKCISKLVANQEFPQGENYIDNDLFDITLSSKFLNVDAITTEDLMVINEALTPDHQVELKSLLNDLLKAVKERDKEKSNLLVEKSSKLLLNTTGIASSIVTIADSYKNGGAAQQFVGKILEYIIL